MGYKDKDRQREADAERQRRRRDKIKAEGVTESGRDKGVTVVLSGGNMDIETLAMVDAGCGDKLTHGLKRGKDEGITQVIEDIGVRDEVLEAAGIKAKRGKDIKPQSYNPMMVGYVPPQD